MERLKWVDRKFHFDVPPGWMPNVIARLAGTQARIEEYTRHLTEQEAEFKPNDKWSVKEHIGHLSDLEDLHAGRLQDFRDRKPMLRAADMANVATEKANHNYSSIESLIKDFSRKRNMFITNLNTLDDSTQLFVSAHPRLKVQMKPVDMATFTAEHDDHHIASILEIVRDLKKL